MSPSLQCKNCGGSFQGAYCSACGQKVIGEFNLRYLWNGLREELFGLESGLVTTVKALWAHPGKMPLEYVKGKTKRYYGPLKYLVFWTAVCLIVAQFEPMTVAGDDFLTVVGNTTPAFSNEALHDFINLWVKTIIYNTNLFFLGLIPFVSFIAWFIYRKRGINYTQMVMLYCYFFGQAVTMLLIAMLVLLALNGLHLKEVTLLELTIPAFLIMWYQLFKTQREFFDIGWGRSIVNGVMIVYGGLIPYWFALYLSFNAAKIILR